ncbi:putative cdc48-dependent protein degradation adaptor protein [Phaeomoniella chlamydospora]|uniref:Putative cdc48-dependent protein degradation adaptor protein n=1 Tax=Phaeomoniella chlamydospora TaxID=158046 RepID=A0A0G2EN18_PHACM|nr:putative cdc48-dependent protein degradation adaptor protein [Phaeomoniella chlamydospora]
MADQGVSHDELVAQFVQVTGSQPSEAMEYLTAHDFNIQTALADFFAEATGEGDRMDSDESDDNEPIQHNHASGPAQPTSSSLYGGGRRLGDVSDDIPVEASSSSQPRSTSRQKKPVTKKFATLGDISSSGHEGHGHDDDSDDDEVKQDFFTGGEKSGLAVHNPDDLKKKIIEKARRAERKPQDEPKPRPSNFTGTARTLGGDDTPSSVIEPPQPIPGMQRPPRVERILHFWSDGFSIDDGELYRSDDPHNRRILEGIRQGSAPLSIMNVLPGQDVDVEIQQHEGPYVKPKQKYKPFEGQGQRLGSPTPGVAAPSSSAAPAVQPSSSAESGPPKVEIDESQPAVTLQVRLGDGTRLTSRFNTTHTIGDVYSFVSAASSSSADRSWVLATTFPSKDLTDKAAALGELSDFKRGGVVVQKWT